MNQEQNNLNIEVNNQIENNDNLQKENNLQVTVNKGKKKSKIWLIIGSIVLILLVVALVIFARPNNKNEGEIEPEIKGSPYRISSNFLEAFDLYFLQLENGKENKIYSPLSIKYALAMLEEGADGEAKKQITDVIGDYKTKSYINSKNMSFANALFIKDTYKDSINDSYTNSLINKYNAEVNVDSFVSPSTVNGWISDKTLGLINNLFDDISEQEILLINALAIDMEWQQKFILRPGVGVWTRYSHENFSWVGDDGLMKHSFKDSEEDVSGMEIVASFNNYDIVKTIGEENIRKTVKQEFEKYLQENPDDNIASYLYGEDIEGLSNDELMEKYLDRYIKEINSNYKAEDKTTDFSLYVDDKVKVFAKDLKEYDGTTLQYVGIMPINEELDSYINNIKASDISKILSNLKELKAENFKDGVVTKITGFIPKFKFEYKLNLMDDLKQLGIKNVFETGKANLINISSDSSLYINSAMHKANIEFSQEGIKASAATFFGGAGAGGGFDYLYDVPVEEIDLTFDKPYMFIIRDKNSKEVWFVGTVYNPLLYSQDTTRPSW